MAEVTYLDDAIQDILALEGSARAKVVAKIRQLAASPEMGHPLGSRATGNLTTFRKVVVGKNTHRILYRLDPDGALVVIWVVSARADNECYDQALARLDQYGDTPPMADFADVLRALKGGL